MFRTRDRCPSSPRRPCLDGYRELGRPVTELRAHDHPPVIFLKASISRRNRASLWCPAVTLTATAQELPLARACQKSSTPRSRPTIYDTTPTPQHVTRHFHVDDTLGKLEILSRLQECSRRQRGTALQIVAKRILHWLDIFNPGKTVRESDCGHL